MLANELIYGDFGVQRASIGLKINVKKTNLQRPGISEGEKVILGNEKIDQMDRLTYLGSIISTNYGCIKDVKSKIDKAQIVFSLLKKCEPGLKYWKLQC